MFNVTIIKLKDIIKIGIILILIYVFSNFILKSIKTKSLLDKSFSFDSANFVEAGIEKQSNVIKNISKDNNTKNDEKQDKTSKNKDLFDARSILSIGANIFSLKENESESGQDDIEVTNNDNVQVENETKRNNSPDVTPLTEGDKVKRYQRRHRSGNS